MQSNTSSCTKRRASGHGSPLSRVSNRMQPHDYVLFIANNGLRQDEVKHLQFQDVEFIVNEYSGDEILVDLRENKLQQIWA